MIALGFDPFDDPNGASCIGVVDCSHGMTILVLMITRFI